MSQKKVVVFGCVAYLVAFGKGTQIYYQPPGPRMRNKTLKKGRHNRQPEYSPRSFITDLFNNRKLITTQNFGLTALIETQADHFPPHVQSPTNVETAKEAFLVATGEQ